MSESEWRQIAAPVTETTLYRLADSTLPFSGVSGGSVSLLISGPPNSFLYAFGGKEWEPIGTNKSDGVNVCSIIRTSPGVVPPTGVHDAPVTSCGAKLPAPKYSAGPQGVISGELARPPSGASVSLLFPSEGSSPSPTSVVATRVTAISRFRTSEHWTRPTFVCAVEAFPTGSGKPPSITELILTAHYSEETALGLFGIVHTSKDAPPNPPPTAGVAAGTMYGSASRYATANLETRTVSVFELVRNPVSPDGPVADPQQVEKRLISSFVAGFNLGVGESGHAIMISPDAASQDCGSIVVCVGSLEPLRGAAPGFPRMPVLTQVLTYGIVAQNSSGDPTYDEIALPVVIPHGRAVLQASLTNYANTLAIVSANAEDYITELSATLYIEAPRGAPSSSSFSSWRDWVPAQNIVLPSMTLMHPMVAYALAPETGSGLPGENPIFFGFSYLGMSDSALSLVIFNTIDKGYAEFNVYAYSRRKAPTPPESLKFNSHYAAASMPALFNQVLNVPESNYVKEYAAWLTSQARSDPIAAGEWAHISTKTVPFGALPEGGKVLFIAPCVNDNGMIFTAQFATNMNFSSAPNGETLDQVLPQNFFRTARIDSVRTINDVEPLGGRRGPMAIVDASMVGKGALDPGKRLLENFKHLV